MGHMKDLLATVYGGGDEAVKAAERLAGMSRWIACVDQEPEIVTDSLSEVVLAWSPGDEWPMPAFVQLEDGKRVWKWPHSGRPTHWRRMPELPEAK